MDPALLRARAPELGLAFDEVEEWAAQLDEEFLRAVLSALLRFGEALAGLAP